MFFNVNLNFSQITLFPKYLITYSDEDWTQNNDENHAMVKTFAKKVFKTFFVEKKLLL